MSRSRLRVPLLVGSLLVLSACGGDDDDSAGETTAASTSSAEATSVSSAPPTPTEAEPTADQPTDAGGAVPAGYPPRPARDQCVVIPEAPDGTYTVYEAGTAVVTRDGNRLVLGPVTASDGWTSRVDDQDDDEIEIDFRTANGDELDLEVEIDDGRLEVQICADDD